tara:strand:- start:1483 stop:2463 length:981 start_codon:yes stop_codon:yes gene_type:complete
MIPVKSKKYDFDITVNPNTYAGELALPFVTAAILGAETINKGRCRLIEGVVHKAVINPLNYDGGLLQAAGCDFNDGASITLAEQVVTLSDLMVNEAICRGTIFPTFMAAQGRMVRDGQIPPAFTDFLLAATAEQAGKSLESIMWTGATPFGLGLLSNDGVIDEAGIDASAMKDFAEVDLDTGTTAFSKASILGYMDQVFDGAAATPGILSKPGCGFYLSYEAYAFFQQAVADKGTEGNYNKDLKEVTYLGYPVYACSGIPNTVDVIAFTYPDNIVVGTNAYTGNEAAQLIPAYQYDGSDNVKVTMNFAVGVNVAVPTDGVVGFAFT